MSFAINSFMASFSSGLLGDEPLLAADWAKGDYHSSFDSFLAIIFDDFSILRRVAMPSGYLGTPNRLPEDLQAFATLLGAFAEAHPYSERDSDLDLLTYPDWLPVAAAAKAIADATATWRSSNCGP